MKFYFDLYRRDLNAIWSLVCIAMGLLGPVHGQPTESVAISLSGAMLSISGTPSNDVILVSATSTEVHVQASGAPPQTFARAEVKSLLVTLADGHDIFNASAFPIKCTVWGQDGNDLIVGSTMDDVLHGGDGKDVLIGGLGTDAINGGFGEDFLVGHLLATSDVSAIKQIWLSGAKSFPQRVNEIRAVASGVPADLATDRIDGGEDLNADVFVGTFESVDGGDLKSNFDPLLDINNMELMNILLITADDLGMQLGCYGDRIATTPHLNAFARSGCRFTQGYVTQASCSPSRSSMLTGLYPHQNGQIGNVIAPLPSTGLIPYQMHAGVETIPTILSQAGYYTGILGKLHVEPSDAFDFQFASMGIERSRTVEQVLASMEQFNANRGDRPFFLMLNNFDPHRPMLRDINGSPRNKITAQQVPNGLPFNSDRTPSTLANVADYYTCINRLDEWFGRVHHFLVQNNLIDNTLIVFLGDNGPAFPSGKTTCFEAGLRVPFLVRWPGVTRPWQVIDRYVSAIDLVPTFLAAARLPQRNSLPGRSMRTLLATDADSFWRESYCAEFNAHQLESYGPQRSIRKGQYKLIVNLLRDPAVFPRGLLGSQRLSRYLPRATGDHVQLFSLNTDPYERLNIAAERPLVTNELLAELQNWRIETNDPLLDADFLRAETQWHIDNLRAAAAAVAP